MIHYPSTKHNALRLRDHSILLWWVVCVILPEDDGRESEIVIAGLTYLEGVVVFEAGLHFSKARPCIFLKVDILLLAYTLSLRVLQ
jgi:hypothetical protein